MPVISEHGGNIHQVMQEYGLDRITDFSASINPLGPPAGIRRGFNSQGDMLVHYPDPNCTELREEIARQHGIPEGQILVSNGSIELIYLIPQVLKPKQSLILTPSFSELEKACSLSGSQVKRIGLREADSFGIGVEEIIANLNDVQLLGIANPNNPTGKLFSPEELVRLVTVCEAQGIWLVVDEAFLEFVQQPSEYSLINRVADSNRLIVLRSMTKFYALAGLRLGYGVADSKTISRLRKFQPPWSVNQLAQTAGLAALKDTDYPERSRQLITRQREFLWAGLSKNKCLKPYPSAANYLLVKLINSKITSSQMQRRLINKGYLIRDCTNFIGLDNSFFRLAVRQPVENRGLIQALQECLT
jgi:threonine-phosphate decarboxylase